jgi:hypothetical protein
MIIVSETLAFVYEYEIVRGKSNHFCATAAGAVPRGERRRSRAGMDRPACNSLLVVA